jgi:putative chitinase
MSFTFTKEQLSSVIGNNSNLDGWYEALSNVLPEYEIDSPQRVSAFIAQCTHESGGFKRLKENLNYRWESLRKVFPKYFPTDELAQEYAHKQDQIANRVYGGRMGNGDESSGDGFRYCGRGLIQLTGKNNYTKFAESIGMSVEEVPALLETFEGAVKSACWFWKTNNLNQYADAGDILTMTKRINGGTIGLEDRIKHYNHALEVFSS